MTAFIKFNKGLLKLPIQVKIWLAVLMAVNLVIPLFYIKHCEAQVVLATFFVSFPMMVALTAYSGFSRLLGLGHVLWFPLIYFLWARLDVHSADGFLGLWIRSLMLLNAVSLVLDVVDVGRYLGGDRSETVSGL